MNLCAIDPGSKESGYVRFLGDKIHDFGKIENEALLGMIRRDALMDEYVIEQIKTYGMSMPDSVLDTVRFSGRFEEAAIHTGAVVHYLTRVAVRVHWCKSTKAKDGNVRQALIDFYGGDDIAIGGVKCPECKGKGLKGLGKARGPCPVCSGSRFKHPPGPLHDFKADIWQACALGMAWKQGAR